MNLITGTSSGLGRHLLETMGGIAFDRSKPPQSHCRNQDRPFDAIIHCAYNVAQQVAESDLPEYLDDNVGLTERLVKLPHRKFIYLSSVDVYPGAGGPFTEDTEITADACADPYVAAKLASEAIVRERAKAPVILRPTTMLGEYARRNSVIRALDEEPCSLFLSGESVYNFVLHEDVGDFIRLCLKNGIEGVFNIASRDFVRLDVITRHFRRNVNFGSHVYTVGNLDNTRAASLLPAFARTSMETLEMFVATGGGD